MLGSGWLTGVFMLSRFSLNGVPSDRVCVRYRGLDEAANILQASVISLHSAITTKSIGQMAAGMRSAGAGSSIMNKNVMRSLKTRIVQACNQCTSCKVVSIRECLFGVPALAPRAVYNKSQERRVFCTCVTVIP